MIVIYHASCHDGFCAAWLLHKVYPDAEFLPFQYGMDPPDVEGKDVIVADFSFPLNVTLKMIEAAKSFLCFDHHKSVDDELKLLPQFVFDPSKSGARLVWEYCVLERLLSHTDFTRDQLDHFEGMDILPAPWLVRYTEDRDLWKFNLKFSREINSGLRLVPFEFSVWDNLTLDGVLDQGRVMVGYFDMRAERAAHNARDVIVKAMGRLFRIPCVNVANPDLISLVGERLAQRDGVEFGMTYFYDGSEFIFSLRSRSDFDVSEVAKSFGGGGHKNAAGFKAKAMFDQVEG